MRRLCKRFLTATLIAAITSGMSGVCAIAGVQDDSGVHSADALIKAGKVDQAISELNGYLKAKKVQDARSHYLLGQCYAKKNDYRKARQHLRIAIRLGRGSKYSQLANQEMFKVPTSYTKPRTGPMTRFLASLFGFGRDRAAGKSPTPTVIDFYAKWCNPCKKLDQSLTVISKKYGDKIKIMRVDVDDPKNDQIVDQYEVSPIPTVIFLNTDGEVVDYSIGYSGEKGLSKGIRKILSAGDDA